MLQTTLRNKFCYFVLTVYITCELAIKAKGQGLIGDATVWRRRQTQISNLFHFMCPRNIDQYNAIRSTFDPLNHLALYSNPHAVKTYVTALESKAVHPRWDSFVRSGTNRDEMIQIIDILYFIDVSDPLGWDLFYNTTAYLSLRVNVGQFNWAMGTIFSTKFFGVLYPPLFHETLPQFYTSKLTIRELNNFSEPPPPEAGHVPIYHEPTYWMNDPRVGDFHIWWHADLPNVLDNKKYGLVFDRKGELFLYMHHQLMARYFAERCSNNFEDIQPLSLSNDFSIEKGFEAWFLNSDLAEFPIRGPNAVLYTQNGFENLREVESRILQAIDSGYAMNDAMQYIPIRCNPETFESAIFGTDVLGALIESSTTSVNLGYYGNLHGELHGNIADIQDPRYPEKVFSVGIQLHPEINLTDPAFFQLHLYIDNLYKRYKYASPQSRTEQELFDPGVKLSSVRVKPISGFGWNMWPGKAVLTTYFEEYTTDISNAVVDCNELKNGAVFRTKRKRLNYHEFEYKLDIFSTQFQKENFIVRIFMAPELKFGGTPNSKDELFWKMIEMDKFPIALNPGLNLIKRASTQSLIITRSGELVRACGFPPHLLLPRGTERGMLMKMFVMVSRAVPTKDGVIYTEDNEMHYPSLSFCGHPYLKYPDDKPMGYPFDKKIHFTSLTRPVGQIPRNYGFYDVIIKHVSQ